MSHPSAQDWQDRGHCFAFQGHQIFACREGTGSDLLLIHGFPTSSYDWALIWPELATRHRLHAIDMLGFGLSDKPSQYAYSIDASADQWVAYVQAQGLREVDVLAHDYGDTVLQELLARQLEGRLPFRIRSACLLNGGVFPEDSHYLLMEKLLLSRLGPLIGFFLTYSRLAKNLCRICAQPLSDEMLREHWDLIRRAGGKMILPKISQYIAERVQRRARWGGALEKAGIPLRLVDGLFDPISGATTVKSWRQRVPNPDVVELDQVGHYPQIEAPQQVLAALRAFWPQSR